MALIKCPDCSKEISDVAEKCIHCGRPMSESKSANSAADVKSGVKQSRAGYEAGNTIGVMGILIGLVICIFNLPLGILIAVGAGGFGFWLAYR